jgi:hypothetical protein
MKGRYYNSRQIETMKDKLGLYLRYFVMGKLCIVNLLLNSLYCLRGRMSITQWKMMLKINKTLDTAY